MSQLRRALAQSHIRKRTLVVLVAVSLVAAQMEAVAFVVISMVIEAAGGATGEVTVAAAGLGFAVTVEVALVLAVGSVLAAAVASCLFVTLQAKAAGDIDRRKRDQILEQFAVADWEYQSQQRPGALQGRLHLAHQAGRQLNALTTFLRASCMLGVFIVVACIVDPVAAGLIGAFTVLLGAVIVPIRLATRRAARRAAAVEYRYGEELGDLTVHASDLRVFGAWLPVQRQMQAVSSSLEHARIRVRVLGSMTPLVYQYGGLLVVVAILIILTRSVGDAGLGGIAAVSLLLLRSVQYGQAVQVSLQTISETVQSMDLLKDELAPPPPRRALGKEPLETFDHVELVDIWYRYPGSESYALAGVSLRLDKGTVVGITGESGSGKSTLAQLLLRLREPVQGELRVDGRNAALVSEESWFARVGYVPQQPQLLHGSLRDNVAFYNSGSPLEVESAIRDAGLSELLDSLPDGLDTPVGPGQRDLSGGQVQRIGIARALVRRPDMIVLDEPTSALDRSNESWIVDTLERLSMARSLLIVLIAHRETTLSLCDRVVTLGHGRVVGDQRMVESVDATNRRLAVGRSA